MQTSDTAALCLVTFVFLLVVKLIVGQLAAALRTGTGCTGATFTTILTGVVPYAGCVLGGLGGGGRLVALQLHRL